MLTLWYMPPFFIKAQDNSETAIDDILTDVPHLSAWPPPLFATITLACQQGLNYLDEEVIH